MVTAELSDRRTFRNLIGSSWHDGGDDVMRDVNPATGEVVGSAPQMGPEVADEAVAAASRAFGEWSSTSPIHRGEKLLGAARLLRERIDSIARMQTLEMGKPYGDSRGEANSAVAFLEYFGAQAYRLAGETLPSVRDNVSLMTLREPLGVVALITPWNFPVSVTTKKLAASLASGNTVVLKPASLTPGVAVLIVETLIDAGVSPGVVNLVTGHGSTLGERLVANPSVQAVSFTGSSEVGFKVARVAAAHGARAQAEMGGKNPAIVMADADLERAADMVVAGAFRSSGQVCTATSRALIHEAVYDQFIPMLRERIAGVAVGDPFDERTYMGPLVDESQMNKVLGYIEHAEGEGARVALGGKRLTAGALERGFYVEPTLVTDAARDSRVATEEIFGPVLTAFRVRDFDDALELANGTAYGLCAAIHTSDVRLAGEFVRRAEFGCVGVNTSTAGWEVQAPFGGKKASGFGHKEQGTAALDFFTEVKTVAMGF